MQRPKTMRPVVRDGLAVLGQLVRRARIERGWTLADAARRSDVSPATFRAIEAGAPGTAAGTLFAVADLLGVPIFGIDDPVELARRRRLGEEVLSLLPSRVVAASSHTIDDGF